MDPDESRPRPAGPRRRLAPAGVSIDSRTLDAGDLFVALQGPSFDGHDSSPRRSRARRRRALVAPTCRTGCRRARRCSLVDDTLAALDALGRRGAPAHEAPRIVAVTGSVGKTRTRLNPWLYLPS